MTILVATTTGCGVVPEELFTDLRETARTAVQDTAQKMVEDVVNYATERALQELDLPDNLDLTSNGLGLDSTRVDGELAQD
jgi:hypothetical protein